jgi:endogenous inhibitor of DNA gyrase (YacG/DUF329 family)
MIWSCPICHKPTDSETTADFPFCSERCRLHDLGNWASGKYVISDPALDESMSPESKADGSSPEAPPASQPDELDD